MVKNLVGAGARAGLASTIAQGEILGPHRPYRLGLRRRPRARLWRAQGHWRNAGARRTARSQPRHADAGRRRCRAASSISPPTGRVRRASGRSRSATMSRMPVYEQPQERASASPTGDIDAACRPARRDCRGEAQCRRRCRSRRSRAATRKRRLLAKWLQVEPRLLLLDEPTQGVDVGARQQIWDALDRTAQTGAAILIASTDYEQLAQLCHRVLVFARGTRGRRAYRSAADQGRHCRTLLPVARPGLRQAGLKEKE